METPFIYNRYVTGKYFVSRQKEIKYVSEGLKNKKNILIYDSPKTGKESLIKNSLKKLDNERFEYKLVEINLLTIRDKDTFYRTILEAYSKITNIDLSYFKDVMEGISHLSYEQIDEIIDLPEKISFDNNCQIILYFKEFQNILLFEDYETILSYLEKKWKEHISVSYIVTGSRINAMQYIFEERKFFYKLFTNINLSPLEESEVSNFIKKTFLRRGKVVDKDLAHLIYITLGDYPWYLWHLCSISYNLTIGYLTRNVLDEALDSLLALHEPRFIDMVNELTTFQISLLKAVYDNESQLTSSCNIDKYHLNSSANVYRVKEALRKKEIISFDREDRPYIIDPLFKLWLSKYFFK